jgi:lactobin A/cerein 7B family class IIb bacteriocin
MTRNEIVQTLQENPEQAREAQEQFQALMSRSATDMDFRQKLLTDPRAAIKEFTGREMAADRSIRFVASEGKPTVVLPEFVGADAELNDAELEAVAGGATPAAAVIVGFVALYTYCIMETADSGCS